MPEDLSLINILYWSRGRRAKHMCATCGLFRGSRALITPQQGPMLEESPALSLEHPSFCDCPLSQCGERHGHTVLKLSPSVTAEGKPPDAEFANSCQIHS